MIFDQLLEFDVCAAKSLFHSPDGKILPGGINLRDMNIPNVCCQLDSGFIQGINTKSSCVQSYSGLHSLLMSKPLADHGLHSTSTRNDHLDSFTIL